MIRIFPVVEFYITNVCNLACRGCNRFNDQKFKGHQYWDDHAEAYEAWSKRLDIPRITIIGGEPTLNPDLEKWAINLRRLWPNAVIMIQTNGTYWKPTWIDLWTNHKVGFGLSLHDPSTAEKLKQQWLHQAGVIEAFVFHQATIVKRNDRWTVHNSDPVRAFNSCDMKHDHTMFKGKLYKCPAMSNLPDFDSQFNLDLTDRQRDLLYSYKPLEADCSEQDLQDFLATKNQHISQCEFCPENLRWHTALGKLQENLPKPNFDTAQVTQDNLDQFRLPNPLYMK